MPREGTKTPPMTLIQKPLSTIEIRYAPGGDENNTLQIQWNDCLILRLDMPREGTKTLRKTWHFNIQIAY